ncbi:MAG: DUF4293 domain-containing protein [Bacteroidota bacterium]
MIQRIQSVFLVIAIICLIASSFTVYWVKSNNETQEAVNLFPMEMVSLNMSDGVQQEVTSSGNIHLFILPLVIAGVLIFSIFQYKNRLRQMQLGALASIMMTVTMVLTVYRSTQMNELIESATHDFPAVGFFTLVGAMLFNLSSNRFIRRDEKLVKSMDRIR